MLVSEKVKVKWNSKNKKYYESKGYIFTKMGEEFEINISDIKNGSKTNIPLICDYCKEEFNRSYLVFLRARKLNSKDSCNKCKYIKMKEHNFEKYGCEHVLQIPEVLEKAKNTLIKNYGVDNPLKSQVILDKMKETNLERYGTTSPFQNEDIKSKIKETNIKKYGTENPFSSEEIKKKIKETNNLKYGVDNPSQSEEIKEKRKQTFLDRFNVENPFQNEEVKDKIKESLIDNYGVDHPSKSKMIRRKTMNTNLERLGVPYPTQNKDVQSKARKTFYINKSGISSTQQILVHKIIGGELNYPISNCSLDIAFIDEKIYVECDFSGHNLCIKMGNYTQEEFDKKEMKRRYFLRNRGWKEIRIISRKDKLPTKQKLIEMIDFAKRYLDEENRSWIYFDIDNNSITSSKINDYYDYGKLKIIKKSNQKSLA